MFLAEADMDILASGFGRSLLPTIANSERDDLVSPNSTVCGIRQWAPLAFRVNTLEFQVKFIPTTVADVEKLKSRAKVLKRKFKIKHREALEKAAREAGYLHWHHVTLSQTESDRKARHLSMNFLCESMAKDALKGETHYLADVEPVPFVLFANGQQAAVLLSSESPDCLLLVAEGQEVNWAIEGEGEDTAVAWNATYILQPGCVVATHKVTGVVHKIPVDEGVLNNCIAESMDEYADDENDLTFHDPDDPDAQAMFRQLFLGEGLEPIDEANKVLLLSKGYSEEAINDAIAAGAQFSRPRTSMVYPLVEEF